MENIYWCSFDDLFVCLFCLFYVNAFQLQNFKCKSILSVRNKIIIDKSSYQLEVIIRTKKRNVSYENEITQVQN